jgi:hypothetical protein
MGFVRSLREIETELAACAATFEAGELLASDAAATVKVAARIRNLATTIEMLAAKRVADSPYWKHQGHRTPAEWLAGQTKSTVGEAIGLLDTAVKLGQCPQVDAKVRAGELTGEQSRALARAVSVDPTAETALLNAADSGGLGQLKDRCRAVEHAASDQATRSERIRRNRSFRHWADQDGAFCYRGSTTAEVGAKLLGALAPFEKAAFDRARVEGRHEPHEAYAADALEALVDTSLNTTTATTTKSRKPSFTVLVDAAALKRGDTEPGETCEIPGVGPVPVSVLHEHADEAIWHALVTDGHDIRTYASVTRYIPTSLRVALEARDRHCVVPGCNVTQGLEIDHLVPLEAGGLTTYDNLARPCHHHHHEMKHRRGWKLTGEPGNWHFTPPDQPQPEPAPDDPDPP